MEDRVVVTGGGGFIGRYVQEELRARDMLPVVVDRQQGGDARSWATRVLIEASAGVIHLAGMLGTDELFDEPEAAFDHNVNATLNILKGCQTNKTPFVGITMPQVWMSVYQITKRAAKDLATAWHREYDVPVTHVRAFNAFGVGQAHGSGHPRKIVPTFATNAWTSEPMEIWGDGEQTVDLIHARTIAKILVEALYAGGKDQVIDAGSGVEVSVNEVVERIRTYTGSSSPVVHAPMRRGETPHTHIKAEGEGWELLSFRPTMDWLELMDAVDSYRPDGI